MRIFFDTCTIIDYLCNRKNAQLVDEILSYAEEREWECFISVGSFYTMTYLLELYLKHNGFSDKEQRIDRLREILEDVLDTFTIADIFTEDLLMSVKNTAFTDLEDSYQYHAAIAASCKWLVTINISDFKNANLDKVKIVTPSDFIELMRGT